MSGSEEVKTGRPRVKLTPSEKEFARLMAEAGLGSIQAARKAFGWTCEPGTSEYIKAKTLAKATRIREEYNRIQAARMKEASAEQEVVTGDDIQWDNLRKFAYDRLKEIRDNPNSPARVRMSAITALEKLSDPAKDVNLIYLWLDIIWRGARAHCPCCHATVPLHKVHNEKLKDWRTQSGAEEETPHESILDLRSEILSRADRRKTPHKGQIPALAAPERHVAGLGAARAGKSWLLGALGLLHFMLPGVEVWILARVYDDARSEVEYIKKFINSIFFPHTKHLVTEYFDQKTGELTLVSKWGSSLKIRSAKSKGSITGRELEAALVAEPGWVPEEIYEELRARMSSRLGRIFVFGTPKGTGGFLARMVNVTGRDPETGKIIRRTPEDRLIENGCPWNVSTLIYTMSPKDNPEYVQSELKAARMELTDAEYASEFEGKMVDAEGKKFHAIKLEHCREIPREKYADCSWVVGIDQGERNFGAVLLGYNGDEIFIANEFFDDSEKTIKANLLDLKPQVPTWIKSVGGDPANWKLTILDQNPPAWNILTEMEKEGNAWPTDVAYRHINQAGAKLGEDWRKECTEFVNQMASMYKLWFDSEHAFLLHDQLMRAQDVPGNPARDKASDSNKGWKINDPWRGDHVADGFMFAMWTVLSNMIVVIPERPAAHDPWSEAKAGFDYKRVMEEKRELAGMEGRDLTQPEMDAIFAKSFSRPRVPVGLPLQAGHRTNPGYEDC